MSEKKRKQIIRYSSNPFIDDLEIPTTDKRIRVSRLGEDDNVLINQETGEVHGTHVTTYKKVDSEQFIKLFTQNIALTFDLSPAGIKAFTILAWTVQHRALSKDEVDLDGILLKDFLESQNDKNIKLTLSLPTFFRGLADLERAKIIAKTYRQGRYFINPNFVFNGDRIAFTTIIAKNKKRKLPDPNQTALEFE